MKTNVLPATAGIPCGQIPTRKLVATCLLLSCLSACTGAFDRADMADAAQRQMRGMTREQVLACMGAPKKKAHEGDTDVWSYLSTDESSHSSSDSLRPFTGYTHTMGDRSHSFCTVNVVMTGGTVTRVNYVGPSGGWLAPHEQCGYAVENCVQH